MELFKLRLCCLFACLFESFYPALERELCYCVMHDVCIEAVSITVVSSFFFPFPQVVEYAVDGCGRVWMVRCFVVVLHLYCFVVLHSCSFDVVVLQSCVFIVFVQSCVFVVARLVSHPVVVVVFFQSCSFFVVVVVDVIHNRCGFDWWIVDYFDAVIGRFPLGVLLFLGAALLVGIVVLALLHTSGHIVSVCVVIDRFGYVVARSVLKK